MTEAMLKAAAHSEIIEVLRKHRPICQITPEILVAAAQKSYKGRKLMQLLLDHEPDVPITEAIMITLLESETGFGSSDNLIELLFERNDELQVTEAMLKAVKICVNIGVLLRLAPGIRVMQDVLQESSNYSEGEELVALLL